MNTKKFMSRNITCFHICVTENNSNVIYSVLDKKFNIWKKALCIPNGFKTIKTYCGMIIRRLDYFNFIGLYTLYISIVSFRYFICLL